MTHSFIAYIDESGDDGLDPECFRRPGRSGGQSHWLAISACILRQTKNDEAVIWRDEINAKMPRKKKRDLHFAGLRPAQKLMVCQRLSAKPLRATSVISNKKMIPVGIYTATNQLYWYLGRYLVERISWFCRDYRRVVPDGDGTVKLIFSRRGEMSYEDFQVYLSWLKVTQDTEIYWPAIDIPAVEARDHSTLAGLQIADALASAFAAGLECDFYGRCEPKFAEVLRRITYCRNKNYFSYGMKLIPKWQEMQLSADQMRFIDLFK